MHITKKSQVIFKNCKNILFMWLYILLKRVQIIVNAFPCIFSFTKNFNFQIFFMLLCKFSFWEIEIPTFEIEFWIQKLHFNFFKGRSFHTICYTLLNVWKCVTNMSTCYLKNDNRNITEKCSCHENMIWKYVTKMWVFVVLTFIVEMLLRNVCVTKLLYLNT